MGFWSGLFTGKDPTLNANINQFGQEAGQARGLGAGLTTSAADWYESILSGDPTKEAKAIAPEAAATQEQGQQKKNQLAEFAPRSGGTAAAVAGTDADTRSQLIKLLGSLQTGAASGAANLGTTEQGMALTAQELQDQAAEQKRKDQADSIFGRAITQDTSMVNTFSTSI